MKTLGLQAFLAALLASAAHALEPGQSPTSTFAAVEATWNGRDAASYLALWAFPSSEAEAEERAFVTARFAERTQLTLHAPEPSAVPISAGRVSAAAQLTTTEEPWGSIEQVIFRIERRPAGWRVIGREIAGKIDGLAHLSLDPAGFRMSGHVLRLPDFQLEMHSGTLFTSPNPVGPTVLVFSGKGRVRFRPHLAREREQLRKYAKRPELDTTVRLAFVRISPGEIERLVLGPPLSRDPDAAAQWTPARRYYERHVETVFTLDAAVAGSPWWTIPTPGDAVVVFEQPAGALTLSIGGSRNEGISLFDRERRRQICLYPEEGRPRDFDEDEGRLMDVVSQDVRVQIDPASYELRGEARLRIALAGAMGALRLRLNDALRVEAVLSAEGRRHLFFRVRNQNTVMVALPSAVASAPEMTVTVRYGGTLQPPPFEQEHARPVEPEPSSTIGFGSLLAGDAVTVYAQPAAWYPQAENEDFASGTLEVTLPEGYTAIAAGHRKVTPLSGNRTLTRWEIDRPVKHLVLAVGRFIEAGRRVADGVTLTMFTTARLKSEAERTLDMAVRVLRLYTEEFGPCPYATLQLVMMEAMNPGGHSPPGVVILVQRPPAARGLFDDPANFMDVPGFFLAHELAHQWWGDGVGPSSYHERWISEATSQYAASRWVRHSRGEGEFRDVMDDMAQWAVRKNEAGPMILGHRVGHIEGDSKLFRAIVYDKGAWVLHMLRGIVGEDAFRRGLIGFQETYRFRKAGTPQFREALERASGMNLVPYFESWIYGTDLPALSLTHHTRSEAGRYHTTVVVGAKRLPGPVPLQITLEHAQGREVRQETLPAGGGQWTYVIPSPPRKVRINEDRGLLTTRD